MSGDLSEQVILTLVQTLDKAVEALAKLTDTSPFPPPAPGTTGLTGTTGTTGLTGTTGHLDGISTAPPEDWDPTDDDLPREGFQLYDNDAPQAEPDNPLGIPGFNWPPLPEDVVS